MEIKSKTIEDADKTILNRKGEEGSALTESGRIMSVSEQIFLRDFREKGLEGIQKNHLDVWLVGESRSTMSQSFAEKFIDIENAYNRKVRSSDEGDERMREYRFRLKDYGDFMYDIDKTFGSFDKIREIPEMIIIKSEKGEYDANWTTAPEIIQKAADKCVERLFKYWDEEIILYLGEHMCCQIATKFDFNKVPINEDSLIEYGLSGLELVDREQQKALFEKYILTKEKKYLEEFFSDEVLKEIHDFMCTYDEGSSYDYANDFWDNFSGSETEEPKKVTRFFADFRGSIDHEKRRRQWNDDRERKINSGEYVEEDDEYYFAGEEVEIATENYLNYRKSMAETAKALPFDEIKSKMRASYVERISTELEPYIQQYTREYDIFEAEKRLIKPVVVLVSENPVQRELMRDYGAEVVLDNISDEEINGLLELVGKVKSSASSLMPEKLRRIKSEFYKSVEEKLDARSEVTAETEKEIEILDDIFKKAGNIKNVLDIACGNGRIDIPLLEKGYSVTGVDANENFLQAALKKVFEKNLSGAQFKKGDVIDYRGVVEKGSQDAVIYTWHSILEAFGVGNTLHTLGDAWQALRPGGMVVFDQPTRENSHMEDGWYGNDPDEQTHYLSYIMTEEEIKFTLKMAGFENVEIKKWETRPNEEYPEGMHKFTVSARKPEVEEAAKSATRMYRGIINGDESYKKAYEEWLKD